jgi:redox-sensitive bicupin YhaK (pirin superfamily)
MMQQNPAQIFKSESRGQLKSNGYNCFSTFNFGSYFEESRKPFGSLHVLNEAILAPQHVTQTVLKANTAMLILPLFGGVDYKDSLGNESFIGVEQIRIVSAEKEISFELINSYEEENVSYLQIGFNVKSQDFESNFKQFHFDLTDKNQLIPLFEISNTLGFIGMYDARKEGFYSLKNNSNGVFVFVINGAFEIENRLLESKDGLSLSGIDSLEWEALSENALLIVFEIPNA